MDKLARDFASPEHCSAEGPASDRRTASRVIVLIRLGKLIADGREFLCVVRDVSEGGVKVRLFHALPDHRQLEIEFDNSERFRIHQVWQTGDLAGFSFVDEVDVGRLIARQSDARPRRQPRLAVEVEATLSSSGLCTLVTLRDISQRGASIECPGWLMIDELVRIESVALPTVHAKVRWRRPPRYGLVFEQTFRLEDLAKACAELAKRAG